MPAQKEGTEKENEVELEVRLCLERAASFVDAMIAVVLTVISSIFYHYTAVSAKAKRVGMIGTVLYMCLLVRNILFDLLRRVALKASMGAEMARFVYTSSVYAFQAGCAKR